MQSSIKWKASIKRQRKRFLIHASRFFFSHLTHRIVSGSDIKEAKLINYWWWKKSASCSLSRWCVPKVIIAPSRVNHIFSLSSCFVVNIHFHFFFPFRRETRVSLPPLSALFFAAKRSTSQQKPPSRKADFNYNKKYKFTTSHLLCAEAFFGGLMYAASPPASSESDDDARAYLKSNRFCSPTPSEQLEACKSSWRDEIPTAFVTVNK